MRRLSIACSVVAVLIAAALGSAQPQSVDLKFKGTPGSQSRYETALNMAMELTAGQPGGGVQLTIKPSLDGKAVTVTRVVKTNENGDLILGTKVESFDFTLDVADLHAQLAIAGPGGGPPVLFKLPELPIQTVMTERGKVTSLEGLEKLLGALPGPAGKKPDLGPLIAKALDKFSQPAFPEKPVSVGDTWQWKMVMDPAAMMTSMGMPVPAEAKEQIGKLKFPIENTSKLVGFETLEGIECAKIEANAPWELNAPVGPPKGEQMTLHETGLTRCTTWFDYAAGRKVRELTDISFDLSVGSPSATVMKMNMKATADMRLK